MRSAGVVDKTSPTTSIYTPYYLEVGDDILLPYWKKDNWKTKDSYYLAKVARKYGLSNGASIKFVDDPKVFNIPKTLFKEGLIVRATSKIIYDLWYLGHLGGLQSSDEYAALKNLCPTMGVRKQVQAAIEEDSESDESEFENSDKENVSSKDAE